MYNYTMSYVRKVAEKQGFKIRTDVVDYRGHKGYVLVRIDNGDDLCRPIAFDDLCIGLGVSPKW